MGQCQPRRTCVGCGRVAPQSELVRVAVDAAGELVLSRMAPGRGCWLCAETVLECATAASRRGRWARGFRRPVDRVAAERFCCALSTPELPRAAP